MTTAIDTSVLIDVLGDDRTFGEASRAALATAARDGALIVSPIVAAELRAAYRTDEELIHLLLDLTIHVDSFGAAEAMLAGSVFRAYRQAGGNRERVVADFMIGAHAMVRADRLLARDRGFFKNRFTGLAVWYPDRS